MSKRGNIVTAGAAVAMLTLAADGGGLSTENPVWKRDAPAPTVL